MLEKLSNIQKKIHQFSGKFLSRTLSDFEMLISIYYYKHIEILDILG